MNHKTSPAAGVKPLAGRRVVITRAAHQASEMAELLEGQGAIPLNYPSIEIAPPEDPTELDLALSLASAGQFDWLVITSANTARLLAQRPSIKDLKTAGLQVAAIGSKTAQAIAKHLRIDVNVIAAEFVAESLAESLKLTPGARIFLPQSASARPVLAEALRASGAAVTAVDAYRVAEGQGGADVPAYLAAGRIDAVTFTSASTVEGFLSRLQGEGGDRDQLRGACLAAIGPVTARAMKEQDLDVDVMPTKYTVVDLVEALALHYSRLDQSSRRSVESKFRN